MNRSHLWKFLCVVFVICWAVYEATPPTKGDLLAHFEKRAVNPDDTFQQILEEARAKEAGTTNRTYANLIEAVGTNDIAKYFPHVTDAAGKKDPSRYVLQRLQSEVAGKIRLGLDLQGGAAFLVQMNWDPEGITNEVRRAEEKSSALGNAIEVLRKRVDSLGVAEPLIEPSGTDRITIQLPGLSEQDLQTARDLIETAAFLEFRMVHSNSVAFLQQNLVPPGYEVLSYEQKGRTGESVVVRALVEKKAKDGLTGKYITSAFVTRDQVTNEPEIQFRLNNEGAAIFGNITRNNIGQQLAIVLDGELYSAPVIQSAIEGGQGVITGQFDLQEAITLANVLENPLEAPVEIIEQRTVDPSLGADSIRAGFKATIIGMLAVATFMLIYYLFAGALADTALALNIVILLGVLASLEATLTLPGIAGILLTVGMAVDANVLIFERIREESASGKSVRGALKEGYGKAFGTIFDSNITTLISAVILIAMGTGPVKGFGYTLTIGICSSLFTALVVTRLIFDWCLAKGWLRSFKMMHLLSNTKIEFLRWAKPAFVISWVLIGAGIGYGFSRGADAVGFEFLGGDSQTLSFKEKIDQGELLNAISALGIGNSRIQYQRDLSSGEETLIVTTRAASVGEGEKSNVADRVLESMKAQFPGAEFKRLSLDSVGPTVGAEILKTAVVAMLLALFGILVYVAFRFELSFAVAAVVAIIHDVLMTLGWFFLTGKELSAPMVAAVLTIVGFSINDTIVIFDRIREDLKLGVRGSFMELINRAVNRTLSRTVITSGTTLVAAGSLFIFGGGVIHDFAFTFVVGIITGTYSSIYIASALVFWWHKGERPKIGSQVIIESSAASARATERTV